MGQTSETQSINGVVTASSSYTYQVTANLAGQFIIPAIKIGQGMPPGPRSRSSCKSRRQARPPHRAGSPAASGAAVANVPGGEDDHAVSTDGQQAFLRLVMPKRDLHVGELVPVQIKAYFRDGLQATINGLPSLSSDAFTLNSLDDKPAQAEEAIDGQQYAVLTWTTAFPP